jgi:hypothetical protein
MPKIEETREKTLLIIMTIRKVVIDEEAPMHNGGR